MFTVEGLKQLGADPEEGIARCMGNEEFYYKLVNMLLDGDSFDKLHEAIEANDLKKGFEIAHALKGMVGNTSLTNLNRPILEMTEALRHEEQIDYGPLLAEMDEELKKLKDLRGV